MKIVLPGTTHEIRIAAKFSEVLEDTRGWILEVQAMLDDEPVPSKELSAFYSEALDVNFLNLPKSISTQWYSLKPINSRMPFNSIALKLRPLPWSKNNLTDVALEIEEMKYAAKSVILNAEKDPVHIMGRVK